MRDPLFYKIKTFLEKETIPAGIFLIGLSGGPDSIALFHLLLEAQRFFPFTLHAVTVDHGWREESQKELLEMQALCQKHGVIFHDYTLEKLPLLKDVENTLRQKRWECFDSVYRQIKADALFLGHQGDDLAETVLKRIMEGAHFSRIPALKECTLNQGMRVCRPLLSIMKKDIYKWLEERQITYFEDPTNQEQRYLRARMRRQIFPLLEERFGKNAAGNIIKLAASLQEIDEYICYKMHSVLKKIHEDGERISVDLEGDVALEKIEFEYLIKEMARKKNLAVPSDILEKMWTSWKGCHRLKSFSIKSGTFLLDNRKIFLS